MPRFSDWIKNTVQRRTELADDDLIALVTDTPAGAAITAEDLIAQLNVAAASITGLIEEGTNVTLDGSGTSVDPYVINATGGGGGGSMTDFLIAGDTGTPQTITDGNTITIVGGTGLETIAGSTDQVMINLDAAALASLDLADSAVQPGDPISGDSITSGTVADNRIASTITRDTELSDAIAAHNADTTSVHGIVNTAELVLDDDTRLTNARTPTAHAATHTDGGDDELSLSAVQITTGTLPIDRLPDTVPVDNRMVGGVWPARSTVTALSTRRVNYITEPDETALPVDQVAGLDSLMLVVA